MIEHLIINQLINFLQSRDFSLEIRLDKLRFVYVLFYLAMFCEADAYQQDFNMKSMR